MLELSLQQVLLRLVSLLVLTGLHGFLVALAARLFGARGPGYDGRLTPNPFTHIDLIAVITFVLFQIGWIRPVAVEASEVRGRGPGLVAVAVLALLATLALALLAWWARPLVFTIATDPGVASGINIGIRVFVEMTVLFVVLNVVPIPPLTGGLALLAVAPRLHDLLSRYDLIVRVVLAALVGLGIVQIVLGPLAAALRRALFGI